MSIICIDNFLISSEIITEFFSCDYPKCKGVCCIIGESGAPLEEEECEAIKNEYPLFSPLLSEESKEVVKRDGYYVVDADGDLVTPLIKQGEECAYACFDDDIHCYCAIEKSFFSGKCTFRKPISCWIYPIRISKLSSGYTALNLHRWHICQDAFEKGKRENIRVYQFLREPIIHHFGAAFYKHLEILALRGVK